MEFRENQAIYLQIADLMAENILVGTWKAGDRIPSIRELAESIQVNPNTVMRTYGFMEDQGIIKNQRGIGFFLAEGAYDTTREMKRKSFISRDVPQLLRLCRVDSADLAEMAAEIRALDPKPGLQFDGAIAQPVVPDVFVRVGADGRPMPIGAQ